jgi:hypothetical protein
MDTRPDRHGIGSGLDRVIRALLDHQAALPDPELK